MSDGKTCDEFEVNGKTIYDGLEGVARMCWELSMEVDRLKEDNKELRGKCDLQATTIEVAKMALEPFAKKKDTE